MRNTPKRTRKDKLPVTIRRLCFLCVAILCLGSATGFAGDPFRYPEGRHDKGELRYINGIPVLTAVGSPEEIGSQIGVLALKPS